MRSKLPERGAVREGLVSRPQGALRLGARERGSAACPPSVCAWDASVRVAVPPGLAFFMAEKSFSHGGAAVQELIIPHLTSQELVR